MKEDNRILIVGYKSLLGSALLQRLRRDGYKRIIAIPPTLDWIDQRAVSIFFQKNKPECIFFIDIKSGGIMANRSYPAEFIYLNLQAQNNVIHSARETGVKKLIFLASSCVYPKHCPQPIREDYLLSGPLEATSEAFALAKIAGIKMCQFYNRQYKTNFISVIPATIYGPNDNFDLKLSHALPALLRRIHEAKVEKEASVTVWGTGKPRREFLYVDDMVDACIFLMRNFKIPEVINAGAGRDISIYELAQLLQEIIGFKGKLKFDTNKPDGAPQKLLDNSRLKSLGWTAKVGLRSGLEKTYSCYKEGR